MGIDVTSAMEQRAGSASEESETQVLVSHEHEEEVRKVEGLRSTVVGAVLRPFEWVGMISKEVNASFVFGIIVTYGVSQGFGGALYKVAGDYYWKDQQKVQPSAAQVYQGIIGSVWDWKPVWGILTDVLPIGGYHRRPYFILSGLLSFTSLIILALESKVHTAVAVFLLFCYTLGVTIADVVIDAEVAKESREKPHLSADIQTLCTIAESIGAFGGFCTSGFIVLIMGPKIALELLLVCGALFLILGFILQEKRLWGELVQHSEMGKRFQRACKCMWRTISCPQVWKPTLYMFISWAASPSIGEGKFYWITDPIRGLGFSQEFVGLSYAIGAAGAIIGTVAYQTILKHCSFQKILFWAQVLVFLGSLMDLALILRWNVKAHLPDSLFFLIDEIFVLAVSKLKWMPQLVLCAKLCPSGIEGTFFAFLMAVDNVGRLTSAWSGALLQHSLGITRDDFHNLWIAAVVRSLLRLLPLCFLFLVPNTDPSVQVIPIELINLEIQDNVLEDKVELVEKAATNSMDVGPNLTTFL